MQHRIDHCALAVARTKSEFSNESFHIDEANMGTGGAGGDISPTGPNSFA
jgi:hypothetical protein